MDHRRRRNYEGTPKLTTQQILHLSRSFCCQTKLLYICVKINEALANKLLKIVKQIVLLIF